jgi:hypothetical protein
MPRPDSAQPAGAIFLSWDDATGENLIEQIAAVLIRQPLRIDAMADAWSTARIGVHPARAF